MLITYKLGLSYLLYDTKITIRLRLSTCRTIRRATSRLTRFVVMSVGRNECIEYCHSVPIIKPVVPL